MPKKIKIDRNEIWKYYKPYNIIIDSGQQVYFYQQQGMSGRCGYLNWWQETAIPRYIGLEMKDLFEIPQNSIDEFLKLNILNSEDWNRKVSISSTMDTVSCIALDKIMTVFQDTANHVDFTFRKTTQEESFVLLRKKWPGLYYGVDDLKWDSTKTLFYEAIDKIESDQIKTIMDFEEAHLVKRTFDEVKALRAQTCDSALYQKLADRLGLKVNALFDFEL